MGLNSTEFVQGVPLAEAFFHEAVKPVLDADFPGLRYAAALIGNGSEVLGFDTEMSSDHHWGPRAMLFLSEADYAAHAEAIRETLRHKLPPTFRGYSTHFTPPDPNDNGVQQLEVLESGPVNHRVQIFTLRGFCEDHLGIAPDDDLTAADWLTMPGQKLRTTIAGGVFHDETGELTRLRQKLAYYPHDVWLYMLAAGWARIGQEDHFLGRTGYVGDELGSRLIGARLVHDLMNLCFLMERQYAPYSKWFGTAFSRLDCAAELTPLFHPVFDAQTWQEREKPLARAYEIVGNMHNVLNITPHVSAEARPFFGRPFLVIFGGRFTEALIAQIQEPEVRRIAEITQIGVVEQFSTSTDLLSDVRILRRLRQVY